jgi:hypothetical protein
VVVVRSVAENLAELWSKLSLSKEESIELEAILMMRSRRLQRRGNHAA